MSQNQPVKVWHKTAFLSKKKQKQKKTGFMHWETTQFSPRTILFRKRHFFWKQNEKILVWKLQEEKGEITTKIDQFFTKPSRTLMGSGNMIVEFFSAEMVLRVCKYRSWRAEGDSLMTSAASLSAREAFCSPSAAITCKKHTAKQ